METTELELSLERKRAEITLGRQKLCLGESAKRRLGEELATAQRGGYASKARALSKSLAQCDVDIETAKKRLEQLAREGLQIEVARIASVRAVKEQELNTLSAQLPGAQLDFERAGARFQTLTRQVENLQWQISEMAVDASQLEHGEPGKRFERELLGEIAEESKATQEIVDMTVKDLPTAHPLPVRLNT